MLPDTRDIQITPVILAGGRGTRLWPLTSKTRSKPFLKLFSRSSLLQKTLERVRGFSAPILVSEEKNREILEAHLSQIYIEPNRIVYEPVGRNTGPAILSVAALFRNENLLLLVMPSDHVIDNTDVFQEEILRAAQLHQRGSVTVLGVKPRWGNPHFGYIVPDGVNGEVREFVEKPEVIRAQALIKEQGALWHSGMFLCYADDLCTLAAEVAGDVFHGVLKALPDDQRGRCIFLDKISYFKIPSISIDYTLLEQLKCCFVREINVEWHDVGTWVGLMRAVSRLKG